jgi:RNA polymerase sigma factor (sigma-70 family)
VDLIDAHTVPATASGSDHDALAALYRRRFPELLRVATAIAGGPDAGYEAVQDAFADTLAAAPQTRDDDALAGYVWRAVVNAARDARRRGVVRRRRENDGLSAANVPATERPAARDDVRAAIAALPERQRLVLFLRYYADLDYEGIARAAGIRTGTVGPTLIAAQRALRRALEMEDMR